MGQLVHLPILADLDRCDVVALAELRPDLGRQVAKKYRISKLYRSHRELAGDPGIDAAVQITGDDFHAPLTVDLLHSGKHVLIEKPLTTNVADGAAMVEAAKSTGTILMVNFMRRYDPGVELGARIVAGFRRSGELGDIVFARSHRFGNDWFCNLGEPIITDEPYPLVERSCPSWLPDNLASAFRYMNNVYSHNLDLLRLLLGEVTSVEFAHIAVAPELANDPTFGSGSTAWPGPSERPSGGQTQLRAVLRFDQLHATISTGFRLGEFWDEETVVQFSDGWVSIRTPPPLLRNAEAEVEVCRPNGQRNLLNPRGIGEWAFRRAHEHFLDCVIGEEDPMSSGEEALENLKVMEAIFAKHLQLYG